MEPKRRLSPETDFNLCIICQTQADIDLNNLTRRGMDTFVNALEWHHDDLYERLKDIIQHIDAFLEKALKCHRTYRRYYTHKKELQKFDKK